MQDCKEPIDNSKVIGYDKNQPGITMAQETIKFTIRQDGMVKEEVQGVYGDACEKLTKNIEDKLGHVHFTQETADRYVNKTVTEQQNVTL